MEEDRLRAEVQGKRAQAFLQEFDMTQQLINQRFSILAQREQVRFDQLQQLDEFALQFATGVQASLGANTTAQAMLQAQSMAGAGQFAGQLAAPVLQQIGQSTANYVSGLFPSNTSTPVSPAAPITIPTQSTTPTAGSLFPMNPTWSG